MIRKNEEKDSSLSPENHTSTRMKDKLSKISSEKVLSSAELEPLDMHALENAQMRVWNTLSHSIDGINKSAMPEQLSNEKNKISFWNKHNKFIAFGGIATLLVLTVGTTSIYWNYKSKNSNKNTTVALNDKKDDKTYDLKSLAAARLTELTGLTVDEYNTVEAVSKENSNSSTPEANNTDSAAKAALQPKQQTLQINSSDTAAKAASFEEVKELTKKSEETQTKTFYSKVEVSAPSITDFSGYYGGYYYPGISYGSKKHPKVDYTKPLTIETWTGSTSSKTLTSQGSNIISLNIYSPEFSIDYRGGKYAIMTTFEGDRNYFLGITNSEEQNPDLQFVKFIVSENQNVKKVGTKVVDGKTLTIFEESYDNSMMQPIPAATGEPVVQKSVTKYYVDLDEFKVKLTEYYGDDKLVYSVKALLSESFANDDASKVKDYSEISKVEMKKIVQNIDQYGSQTQKLTEFIKKHPIYYSNEIQATINWANDYDVMQQSDQSYMLYQNADFDPTFDPAQYENMNDSHSASYMQDKISINISKKNMREEDPNYFGSGTKTEKQEMTITIDGKEKKATLYKDTYEDKMNLAPTGSESVVANAYTNYSLVFQADNSEWYTINEYPIPDISTGVNNDLLISKPGFALITLTPAKAEEMDKLNEEKEKANPKIEYNTQSLDSIDKNIRLLPGDLSPSFDMILSSVVKSSIKGSESTCDKFFLKDMPIECLIEKYNGFKLSFNPPYKEDFSNTKQSPDVNLYRYFDFVVLNTPNTQVLDILKDFFAQYTIQYPGSPANHIQHKEIDGKTVILMGSLSDEELIKIMNDVKIDNGYDALKVQFDTQNQNMYNQKIRTSVPMKL